MAKIAFEPVSEKTGLNDIEMKIQITALRESINFSECFLKIREDYMYYHYLLPRYRLLNHAGSAFSVYDVINVVQVCFDVNVVPFVYMYFWCV